MSTPILLLWIAFGAIVAISLFIDIGLLNKSARIMSTKHASLWTSLWVSLAFCFGIGVYFFDGAGAAIDFTTAYILELSLSVDNLFVFLLIFRYFKIEPKYQHRVLFWGVIGAIVFRAIFIFSGIILINKFEWILLVFSVFLIYMGIKIALEKDSIDDKLEETFIIRFSKKLFPVVDTKDTHHFFVTHDGKQFATTLMVTLVCVELSDIAFAIDSVPVVLAVTSDPLVVFTSNIFAIMGLRSMYFLLANILERLEYLKYGLGSVLAFIGIKILIEKTMPESWQISEGLSLIIIFFILISSTVASLLATNQKTAHQKTKKKK